MKTGNRLITVPEQDRTLQVQVPASTKLAIHIRSAETGDPMRVLVLRALAAYGFPVPKEAITDRRKPQ
ncbi:MAG: hypothetical protein F4Y60_01805 [Boseongicola sp. SB0664_bin_43]|uniref:Uncharacterized protein n=1 Tax=Boseongicola sp. SB0664_bin_43 TaxID=2604844 RepID=A0A6B0XWA2_9RHOB|nr:hypothetical protein [Boseongicola sp. SB0664_bin_43]MYK31177.1 hypothetical protein [Boseongicola sp. SB0670_bin_30]